MEKRFDYFLKTKFQKIYPMILDDDLPDRYEYWIEQLTAEDLAKYKEEFDKEEMARIRKEWAVGKPWG